MGRYNGQGECVLVRQPEHKKKAHLLGVGLDNQDGEVRVTRGKNFHLLGGSQDTHESMQEKCVKFNEKLDQRGKEMEQLEKQELLDIAAECEMPIATPRGES
jgi:hypothetical protein